ncbi:post-GPI attachment to proteins factor 4-like [Ptychodera flava]|uniref:post-GPI attachment to proteins factor 4-like n=1 Tax=Ptychodera flava TaxID=63121 RepID=UPI00396A22F0
MEKRNLEVEKAIAYFSSKESHGMQFEVDGRDTQAPWVTVGVITVKRHVKQEKYNGFKPKYVIEVAARLNQALEKFPAHQGDVHIHICNMERNSTNNDEAMYLARYMHMIERHTNVKVEGDSNAEGEVPVDQFESEQRDYAFCLGEMAKFGAKYTIILQDDAVVHDNFFTNLKGILETKVERRTTRGEVVNGNTDNLAQIKLYFPEKWQGYEWNVVSCLELLSIGSFGGSLLLFFYGLFRGKIFNNRKQFRVAFCLSSLFCILLASAIGRQNLLVLQEKCGMYHIRPASHCCIPAVLYTRKGIDQITEYIKSPELKCSKDEPLDVAIGKYVDRIGMQQIAVVPNMVDHIGIFSTLHSAPKNPKSFFPK